MQTGTDIIRAALISPNRRINLARLARDLRLPAAALEDFCAGRGPLTDAVLCTLTLQLFGGHTVFLPELDKLGPANTQEPTPLGHGPPPLDPATLPTYQPGPAQAGSAVPVPQTQPVVHQEATPMGSGPPPPDPQSLPRYTAGPAQHPVKVPAPPPKRPRWGWID